MPSEVTVIQSMRISSIALLHVMSTVKYDKIYICIEMKSIIQLIHVGRMLHLRLKHPRLSVIYNCILLERVFPFSDFGIDDIWHERLKKTKPINFSVSGWPLCGWHFSIIWCQWTYKDCKRFINSSFIPLSFEHAITCSNSTAFFCYITFHQRNFSYHQHAMY